MCLTFCDWLNGDDLIKCYWTDKPGSKISLVWKNTTARRRNGIIYKATEIIVLNEIQCCKSDGIYCKTRFRVV
jgi:hypothetical protein